MYRRQLSFLHILLLSHPEAMTIEEGIDFIVSHFEEPIWPRTIFTPKEKQVLVYDKEEVLARFKRTTRLQDKRLSGLYRNWQHEQTGPELHIHRFGFVLLQL